MPQIKIQIFCEFTASVSRLKTREALDWDRRNPTVVLSVFLIEICPKSFISTSGRVKYILQNVPESLSDAIYGKNRQIHSTTPNSLQNFD